MCGIIALKYFNVVTDLLWNYELAGGRQQYVDD